jgi:hypothetical protein
MPLSVLVTIIVFLLLFIGVAVYMSILSARLKRLRDELEEKKE